jgi:hypothetical protein
MGHRTNASAFRTETKSQFQLIQNKGNVYKESEQNEFFPFPVQKDVADAFLSLRQISQS